ncbi:PH domain-containing protein [Actinomadura sp. 7K507]|uniref:PH domain-containing protein n=1 Tax=Actinomadura sp. 7K507 TaxID=2530365 RepID=UPI00104A2FD5|nr:PH domain-containing protein [Actinomadura sp. 7K507]TDC81599.1 PH domain-containing protein [Actinomadura sp. 7K507]
MTIRSTGGRVAAWAWLTFAALNIADLVFGITGDASYSLMSLTIGVLLLLGSGIAYTAGLRPAIVGDDDAVTVRNPLRDVRVPWGAVRAIRGTNAVTVRFTGPDGAELETRAWVHQTSPRAQAKAEARAKKEQAKTPGIDLTGRTPAAYTAQRLNEILDRRRPKTRSKAPDKAAAAKAEAEKTKEAARGTVKWSVPAVASLAVPAVALIVLAVVGAVT